MQLFYISDNVFVLGMLYNAHSFVSETEARHLASTKVEYLAMDLTENLNVNLVSKLVYISPTACHLWDGMARDMSGLVYALASSIQVLYCAASKIVFRQSVLNPERAS